MSIPLKAVCGAATLALMLAPGIGEAQVADHNDAVPPRPDEAAEEPTGTLAPSHQSDRPVGKQGAPEGLALRQGWFGRANGVLPQGQTLVSRQRAARQKRARLIEQWQHRADRAVRFALRQRGKPYRWGATGPSSYDCSGLVQRSWRRAGVSIPRVTHAQYRGIRKKVSRNRLRPGDLVLFNGLRHVGMYVGRGRFVHAPRTGRTVTTERLRGHYSRSYVGAVRPAWPRLPRDPMH